MRMRADVRTLDPTDAAQLRRFHEIGWRAEKEDGRPWNTFWSATELAAVLREPVGDALREGVCLYQDGRMVAAGLLQLSLLDNTDKAWVFAAVEPELRGRGYGGRVVEDLLERVRAAGRRVVLAGASAPVEEREDLPVVRFARAHGFRVADTEIHRTLDLPLEDGLLDRLGDGAAPHHEGIVVETHVDRLPARYLPSYCHLLNQLGRDAPTGEVDYEAERLTPRIVTLRLARARRMGRTTLFAVAVREGEVVAHSDLFVLPSSRKAHQMGTLVRRDLRGHRLGTAVKVANLRLLTRRRPDVTEVHTQNAEANRWMVDINERLGFRPVGVCPAFLLEL